MSATDRPVDGMACWTNPSDGVMFRFPWNLLEPTLGHYDFSALDAMISLGAKYHKAVGFYLAALDLSACPSDLKPDTITIPGTHSIAMAYPWGKKWLDAYLAFLPQLAPYDGKIAIFVMGGLGENGASVLAKDDATVALFDAACSADGLCGLDGWKSSSMQIVAGYAAALKISEFNFCAKNPYGLANPAGGTALDSLVRGLAAQYPHMGTSNPDLFAGSTDKTLINRMIHDLSATNPAGFQLRDQWTKPFGVGLDGTLAATLTAGINEGADELQVYDADCNNADLAPAIKDASASMRASK